MATNIRDHMCSIIFFVPHTPSCLSLYRPSFDVSLHLSLTPLLQILLQPNCTQMKVSVALSTYTKMGLGCMELDARTARVTHIDSGSQAEAKGIACGWTVKKVGTTPVKCWNARITKSVE